MQSGNSLAAAGYELPALEELQSINLNEYTGKKNLQRQAFRLLYTRMVQQTRSSLPTPESNKETQALLASALLFEYLEIVTSYPSEEAAKYRPGMFYNSGSRMNDLLWQKLHFNTGRLSSYEQIILLSRFYHFIKTSMGDDLSDGVYWKNKQALLDSITPLLQLLLQHRNKTIEEILAARPPLDEVIKKSKQARSYYSAKGSHGYFPDRTRELQFMLIDFVNDSCSEVYGNDVISADEQYAIRMGLFYFLGKQSNRGTFHDFCKQVMNKTTLTTIKKADYNHWQMSLLQHLELVKANHPDFIKNWQINNPKRREFAEFLNQLQSELLKVEIKINVREFDSSQDNVHALSRTAAGYGVDFVYSSAAQAVLNFLGITTIDLGLGAVGLFFGGPIGAALATNLSSLIRNKILPDGAKYFLCGNVLNSLTVAVGNATAEGISTAYKYTLQSPVNSMGDLIRFLLEIYKTVDTEESLQDKEAFINALMLCPDEAFSAERKEKLVYTHQVEKEKYPEEQFIEFDMDEFNDTADANRVSRP